MEHWQSISTVLSRSLILRDAAGHPRAARLAEFTSCRERQRGPVLSARDLPPAQRPAEAAATPL